VLIVRGAIPDKAATGAVPVEAADVENVHIAIVSIRREVERILAKHGYNGTTICTPDELL
jgi:hypothetical protein